MMLRNHSQVSSMPAWNPVGMSKPTGDMCEAGETIIVWHIMAHPC